MGSEVRVGADGLQRAIRKALEETRELTEESLRKAVDRTAKEIVDRTKGAAPVKSGKYAKGWASKSTGSGVQGGYGKTVYQRTKPGLAHLLQHGHGGPRSAKAYPHIPSDEETEELLVENLEKEMGKG